MKANVHTPQRLEGESFSQYKSRRSQSKSRQNQSTLIWDSYSRGTFHGSLKRMK